MKVCCPECGHKFKVQSRAPMGAGTQRKTRINYNRANILFALRKLGKPSSVSQIVTWLQAQGFMHKSRYRSLTEWGYHKAQADVSLLVGNGQIIMVTDSQEIFDATGFMASPKPLYKIKEAKT